MRSRSMTLLSVMVVASSIIAGTGLARQSVPPPPSELTGWQVTGIAFFVVYVLVTIVVVIHVASPTDLPVSDVLLILSAAEPLQTAVHVYENHVHNLNAQIEEWSDVLDRRARSLKVGLVAALFGVVGFVLLWINGSQVEVAAACAPS